MLLPFHCRLMKIPAWFQKQYRAGRLGSIHLPTYQQKGSSFRVVFWEVRYNAALNKNKQKKGLIHQSWLLGSAAALNRESKCEDFIWNHSQSPNEVELASGCEWEWVAKCNDKLHTECLCRLFEHKGLQVTKNPRRLRRNNDFLERLGGSAVLSSSSLVSIRE